VLDLLVTMLLMLVIAISSCLFSLVIQQLVGRLEELMACKTPVIPAILLFWQLVHPTWSNSKIES